MRKIYQKLVALLTLIVIDTGFFTMTNPVKAQIMVVIVGFVLLSLTTYVLLSLLVGAVQPLIGFSQHTKRRIVVSATIVVAVVLAMQSIGQLTLRDVVALVPILALLSFYAPYTFRKQPPQA